MAWTLNGTSLESLGVSGPRVSFFNQASDTLEFVVEPATIEAGSGFSADDAVTLKQGGDTAFRGKVLAVRDAASGSEELISVACVGGWWWLDNLVYQQSWKAYLDGRLSTTYKSRVLLGQAADGSKLTAAQIITAIIDYAEGCGLPVSAGSISLPYEIPVCELLDVTCGEAIRAVLRWFPDVYMWFDHENGVFNLKRASQLAAASIAVNSESITQFQARERTDLAIPQVVIYYEYEDSTDSGVGAWAVKDAYPAGSNGQVPGALVATIELGGGSSTSVGQRLKTEAIDTGSLIWWEKKIPWISNVKQLTMGSIVAPTFDREIIDGDVPAWEGGGPDVTKKNEVATAKISYDVWNDDGEVARSVVDENISVRLTTTSLFGGYYTRMTSSQEREPIPQGLAEILYTSSNQLYYEGNLSLGQDEATTNFVGKRLLVTGGPSAWSSMVAPVYACTLDIDTGETSLNFGPPAHLGIQDLIQRLRANRKRKATMWLSSRATGKTKSEAISIGGGSSGGGSAAGSGTYKKLVLQDGDKKIVLKPSDLTCGDVASFQKIGVATSDGFKTVMALVSEEYCPDEDSPFEEIEVQLCEDNTIVTRKLLAFKVSEP